MTIQIDTREKQRAVKQIISHFDKHGIKHYPSKLYVGDYMNPVSYTHLDVYKRQMLHQSKKKAPEILFSAVH